MARIIIKEYFTNKEYEVIAEYMQGKTKNSYVELIRKSLKGYREKFSDFYYVKEWGIEIDDNGLIDKKTIKKENYIKNNIKNEENYMVIKIIKNYAKKKSTEDKREWLYEGIKEYKEITIADLIEDGYMDSKTINSLKKDRVKSISIKIIEYKYEKNTKKINNKKTIKKVMEII